jgi:isoquinoline 1-oxidoreductase
VKGEDLVAEVTSDVPLTPASSWKVAGNAAAKADGRDFVTGKHRYASDWNLPGMLHGKALRPAAFRATLVSLDASDAEKLPGVRVVRDGDFVGVAAPDAGTAARAVAALHAKWNEVAGQPSRSEIFDYLRARAEPGEDRQAGGSMDALESADARTKATYTVEYIAHSPLETRAAAADWKDGKLTVWTGTQRPFAVREELAEALRIPADKVRVIVPDTGSAYGGKHTGDAAVEAARLSKAAGRPVKVVWTREEEFTWAYFRPAGVIDVRAGARKDGGLVAWEFHNYNSGPAGIQTPYDVPNRSVRFRPVASPLRQGSYRALAATANHFARESHMDELAKAVGMDPLEFRRKNLSDARLRAALDAAADRFGWTKRSSAPGRGAGIACGVEKGGYVAACAEVEVDPASRRMRILRLVTAFECGAVVNPDGLRNQIEGAVVQGLGGALFEAVRFGDGRIENPHFAEYRVPRFSDVPPIDLVILDRKDLPSAGAGETPIVGVAPAIANAIFAASGVRLRRLPLMPDGVVPAAAAG